MDINDYTYEHQIIRQADYLINQLSNNSINGVQLNPKAIFAIKIFAYIEKKAINISDSPRFPELKVIINDFLNSKLTENKLSGYINDLKNRLNRINIDGAALVNILDELDFLIILNYLDPSLNFLDTDIIKNLLVKLNNLGNHENFVCLLNLCNNDYDKDTFPSKSLEDIPLESLIQLKLSNIILNTDSEFYTKIKTRRLLFIKNVYDKLDLLKNNNILRPSINLIYSIFIAASVLELLEYNNSLSLNKSESLKYIDKEFNETMIEKEIKEKIEKNRKELVTFSAPLQLVAEKFKLPLFIVLLIYIILWIICSVFLYFRIFKNLWIYIFFILLAYTFYLLYESYIKSYKK